MPQRKRRLLAWAALGHVVGLAACSGSEARPAAGDGGTACVIPETTTLGGDAAACGDVLVTIVRETCVGGICHHAGGVPAGHLDLLSPCAADRLVGVVSSCDGRLLVDPVDPSRSFLLEKLESDAPACGGKRMPYDNHLEPADLACMRQWVEAIAMATPRSSG